MEGKKVSESKHGGPIKESSIEFWQNHIDRFIVPTLGAYRMDIVDTALIEKKREAWKELGLTAPSINKVLTTLSAIFDKQLALRTIRFNPVTLAERMARGSNEVGENDEIDIDALEVRPEQVYSPDRLLKLIQSAEPGFAQSILTTFALTGLRHGEGLALMWRDIDFDQREITIRRNWSGLYRDGEPVFSTPKTKHSIRKIHISDELCLALKKWKPKNVMAVIGAGKKIAIGVRRRKYNPKTGEVYYEIEYDGAMTRFWIERFVPAARADYNVNLPSHGMEEFYKQLDAAKRARAEREKAIETRAIPAPEAETQIPPKFRDKG